jgi:hypothetical protein
MSEKAFPTTKVKDLELDEFVEKVMEHDDETAKKVIASGLDAEKIIGKAKPSIDKYGVSTGVAYAIARLKEAILEANSESLKGLLVGQRDMYGTNAPIRMPVLSSKGDHVEVVNWGSNVKMGDNKVEIEFPCTANLRILQDGEYKGVPNIKLVSMESCDPIGVTDAVSKLTKIAKSAGELDGGDELGVVVVRGRISYIAPATRWKGKEKDGSWPIWLPNQRDNPINHAVMQISLETENNNMVRTIFGRQRIAVPTIVVDDFEEICTDAVKKYSEPTEQARFVGDIFRGRDVIIVGFMTKYNPMPEVNYIDISGYAMFEVGATGKQTTLDAPAKKQSRAAEPEDDDAANEANDEAGRPEPKAEPKKAAPAKKDSKKDGAGTVEKLKEKIKQYCDVLGIEISDLTPEKVIETLAPGKTKSFVVDVLDELKKEQE